MIEPGLKHSCELVVTDAVTAIAMGSGDMPVLATPAMMALMEQAAMLAVRDELPDGSTTVGGHIESSHLKPTKIGDAVRAVAEVTKVDGRKIWFKVAAYSSQSAASTSCPDKQPRPNTPPSGDETLLGEGTHLRFVVDREKFLSMLSQR